MLAPTASILSVAFALAAPPPAPPAPAPPPAVAAVAPPPTPPPPSSEASSVFVSVSMGRARLGITATSMTEELRQFFGAKKDVGILVSRVHDDSPAAKGGLKVGDVLVAVDSDAVADVSDVHRALADRNSGDEVDVVVVRNKKRLRKKVTLSDDASDVMFGSGGPGSSWSFGGSGIDSEHIERRIERELQRARDKLERLERQLQRLEKSRKKKKKKTRAKGSKTSV